MTITARSRLCIILAPDRHPPLTISHQMYHHYLLSHPCQITLSRLTDRIVPRPLPVSIRHLTLVLGSAKQGVLSQPTMIVSLAQVLAQAMPRRSNPLVLLNARTLSLNYDIVPKIPYIHPHHIAKDKGPQAHSRTFLFLSCNPTHHTTNPARITHCSLFGTDSFRAWPFIWFWVIFTLAMLGIDPTRMMMACGHHTPYHSLCFISSLSSAISTFALALLGCPCSVPVSIVITTLLLLCSYIYITLPID